MTKTIFIIEDDNALNNGIALALKNTGYSFKQFYTLGEVKDPDTYYTRCESSGRKRI